MPRDKSGDWYLKFSIKTCILRPNISIRI